MTQAAKYRPHQEPSFEASSEEAEISHTRRKADPLSELARITGQDDPFKQILTTDKKKKVASPPPVFEDEDEQAYASYHDDWQNEPSRYEDDADHEGNRHYEEDLTSLEPRRSRKALAVLGLVLATGIGSVGYYVMNRGPAFTSGEPPLIKAETSPLKIQPQNPGGVEIPDQNKQIYERTGQEQTKVVNREEQPMDVAQAIRAARMTPQTSGGNGASSVTVPQAPLPTGSTNPLGEPKRVRTVTVKPDGTILSPTGQQQAATAVAAPKPIPMARPASVTPSSPPIPPAPSKPQQVVQLRTDANDQMSSFSETSQANSSKLQQRLPVAPSPATTASLAPDVRPPASVGSGNFSVQLAGAGSEQEAKATFANLQRKFSNELSGFDPIIRKADVSGKTVYRLRVGSMSKEDAQNLCVRLKAAGGTCFVAAN